MADGQAKDILRTALLDFDSIHLGKIVVAAYDRWNWDTGSEADKDWFELAEEILKERGIDMSNATGTGPTTPVLTMDSAGDLMLGTNATLKIRNTSNGGSPIEHDILEATQQGALNLGVDLKYAIAEFIANELRGGSITAMNGQSLKQILEDGALAAIRNRI